MTTPTGPAILVKGQNAPLAASSVRITVEVQAPTDLSALLVTDSGKVRSDSDFVFFNQPDGPGVRCVKDGSGWQLTVQTDQIPADIQTVRAVVNLETPGQRFGQVAPPVARIADAAGGPIAEYRVTGLDSESIMVAVELYRRGADWKARAVGQGYAGGLADLISDHGVSVDDAGSQAPAAPTPPARIEEPDTGGVFGNMQPAAAQPTQPAPGEPPDTGGAFGHLQPQQPVAPRPPATQPPPPPPAGGYPPPPQPSQQQSPAAFPPPSAPAPNVGYPPPTAAGGPAGSGFPPPTGAAQGFPPPGGAAQGFPPPGGAGNYPPPTGAPQGQQPPAGLSAQRPVSLQKGQRVSLRKESGGNLTVVRMGLGWDPLKKRGMFGNREVDIDLDASAVMFADKQLADVVFYNNLRSKDGSVQHQGDNRTGAGDGDDETVLIDLDRVAAHINSIVFIVTSYEGQTFEQVQNAFCRLIDNTSGGELARYTLTGGMAFTGMVMAKVFRDGGGWQMQAIGEGIQARTPSDSFPQLPRFL
ncbi:TerD family protein [Nakamurella lactea]|uniref:TerD family protein n=1 Tax=Nakamurella lactea TaxID=459515 RepID=UPI00041316D6|nr:TerD family protein [Nakamurella lactea]